MAPAHLGFPSFPSVTSPCRMLAPQSAQAARYNQLPFGSMNEAIFPLRSAPLYEADYGYGNKRTPQIPEPPESTTRNALRTVFSRRKFNGSSSSISTVDSSTTGHTTSSPSMLKSQKSPNVLRKPHTKSIPDMNLSVRDLGKVNAFYAPTSDVVPRSHPARPQIEVNTPTRTPSPLPVPHLVPQATPGMYTDPMGIYLDVESWNLEARTATLVFVEPFSNRHTSPPRDPLEGQRIQQCTKNSTRSFLDFE